ncbi:hypothetical protein JQ617_12955 [Bradyrhizobium sp. KB893862 SZCCT0404]|uniref:hypothetical protein n=1 Tax=Bradyrhizobium sp. KB893862 SZCCT0404 TaxID=2807672 RepID=UPI001BAD85E5|nr:hypothetical protein [Bradyrhizobium sp. KB893862 SZCCT0404]MBR1174871.1 hypothetical protein [Bradyrhizobium sp. KB893862 SZCCT0404]
MSDPDTLGFIAHMADKAIQREIERRIQVDAISSGDGGERLLLYLSIIKRAAFRALLESERAAGEQSSALVKLAEQNISNSRH